MGGISSGNIGPASIRSAGRAQGGGASEAYGRALGRGIKEKCAEATRERLIVQRDQKCVVEPATTTQNGELAETVLR